MYRSQHLAVKYFAAAITLFGVMTLTGLMSAYYYLNPEFLFGILPFNIAKILHIDTMVIWLLMGFIASIYWFLPEELGREPAGIRAAEILFYVFCTAVAVVAVVFVFVQYGGSNETRCGLSTRAENMSKRLVGPRSASSAARSHSARYHCANAARHGVEVPDRCEQSGFSRSATDCLALSPAHS